MAQKKKPRRCPSADIIIIFISLLLSIRIWDELLRGIRCHQIFRRGVVIAEYSLLGGRTNVTHLLLCWRWVTIRYGRRCRSSFIINWCRRADRQWQRTRRNSSVQTRAEDASCVVSSSSCSFPPYKSHKLWSSVQREYILNAESVWQSRESVCEQMCFMGKKNSWVCQLNY